MIKKGGIKCFILEHVFKMQVGRKVKGIVFVQCNNWITILRSSRTLEEVKLKGSIKLCTYTFKTLMRMHTCKSQILK